jgi:hypothetical protein
MKFLITCIFLSVVVASCSAIDRDAFTFTNYDLNVRVDPGQQRLGVRGKISLRNDSSVAQKNVFLQISSSLDWVSIEAQGKPLQFVSQPYTSDIDHTGGLSEAIVTLPQAVAPKQSVELDVGYEGEIALDATRLTRIGAPEADAKHSDWDQIAAPFSVVRGIGYVVWYPVATEAASLSDRDGVFGVLGNWASRESDSRMELKLCVDPEGPPVKIITNGIPVNLMDKDRAEVGGSCQRFQFQEMKSAAPAFAVGPYQELQGKQAKIEYLPQHESGAEAYSLAADLSTPSVTDWFGKPRQLAEFVDIPDAEAAPFESGTLLFAPLSVAADSRLAQMTAVHQLTHAAFPSPRLWISEGLATFAQAAYQERLSGREAALDFLGLHRAAVLNVENSARKGSPEWAAQNSLINTSVPELYRSKAALVWWMLRDLVGESALKKALAAYRPGEDKDPAYTQKLIQAQTKQDLEWFFDDWVYRDRGLPDFRVGTVFPRQVLAGGYVVTVTIENLGNAGGEVPVTLKVESGDQTKRLLVPANGKASIRFETSALPNQVAVNDGSVPESDWKNNVFKIVSDSK